MEEKRVIDAWCEKNREWQNKNESSISGGMFLQFTLLIGFDIIKFNAAGFTH